MGTIETKNERSWAIFIITEIKSMLDSADLKIKSVGGKSTLSTNKKKMFPDVLLYGDNAQTRILQGWELKMPDVLITDEELIADATRKARALKLNSFVIWNFTYGKLYVEDPDGNFIERKIWTGTDYIVTREDVMTYKEEWIPIIKDIVLTVNEYLRNGIVLTSAIESTISEGLITELIEKNKDMVAEQLESESATNMIMERKLNVWWKGYSENYQKDKDKVYSEYAKNILLNWTNRITFSNIIKRFHNCAYDIEKIDYSVETDQGNIIIDGIIKKGDFFHILNKIEYNECIPKDTWIDIVDYNQFLISNHIEHIDQSVLQDILEKTVSTVKREIRGQYATPYKLANILCQLTVENWEGNCADFCAGTGTIAKAILKNKERRLKNKLKEYQTTWISDKYAYPLQIANIALASIDAVNIPINSFKSDIFEIKTGDKIILRSPVDGEKFEVVIPEMDAVISNLPFVKYNNNPDETKVYMEEYNKKIYEDTGILFKNGKSDIYNYLPFKIHELLKKNGKLGIIISNSWLGSELGSQFFDALQFYYKINSVVISGKGKWFDNADVIATILIMEKKEISEPNPKEPITFFRLDKNIIEMTAEETEDIINAIVLKDVMDIKNITMQQFSREQLKNIEEKGICLNSVVHDIEWIEEIKQFLEPISKELDMIRGERTGRNEIFYIKGDTSIAEEYLYPMLKSSQSIKGLVANADMKAFCCDKSIEQLKAENDEGTLKWIRKFSDENYNPIYKSINYIPWYQMPASNRADLVTSENPDRRLFIAELKESVIVDQRLIAMKYKKTVCNKELVFALLNSIYGMFVIEANGFGRGQGVLDISKTRFEKVYMINPNIISENDAEEIIELFQKLKMRNVLNVQDELEMQDREKFDRKVLKSIGCEDLYEKIKKSILSMQHTRHDI